jgi:DNA-binding response OmpR family regulator
MSCCLDVMLPDTDGFEMLRQTLQHLRTPVLMLTARGDVEIVLPLG